MREIKFRELLQSGAFHYWGFLRDGAFIGPSDPRGKHMQFTGLKDKNGKEIYEGDVIKRYNGNYEVVFDDGGFCLMFHQTHNETDFLAIYTDEDVFEVIGNIYSNPDLLNPL